MDNYRPGVTKKLGIDFESLRKINPKIVCCSITGTGPSGPDVKLLPYDTVGQGMGGMMSVLMDPKNPKPVGPAYADGLSGMFSALGVLGALVARATTGKGQQVDATMVGSILAFLNAPATETLAHGRIPGLPVQPAAPVADLCLRLRRWRHAGDSSVVAAKILGRAVQFGRPSGDDRRPALQVAVTGAPTMTS